MAFADPQTLTVNAVANTLPRVSSGETKGVFRKDDGNLTLQITSNSNVRRVRQAFRVEHRKVAPDPLMPATNSPYSLSVTLVVDTPVDGYTIPEKKQIVDALTAYLTASSGARVTQLLGGEI